MQPLDLLKHCKIRLISIHYLYHRK